jgi:hypothetical protein
MDENAKVQECIVRLASGNAERIGRLELGERKGSGFFFCVALFLGRSRGRKEKETRPLFLFSQAALGAIQRVEAALAGAGL